MKNSHVYIATNNTGTLYIGVTSDIENRGSQHYVGHGSAFTSKYGIKHVIYIEEYSDIKAAIAREKQLKGWRREKKVALINRDNPGWNDLLLMGPSASLRVTDSSGLTVEAA